MPSANEPSWLPVLGEIVIPLVLGLISALAYLYRRKRTRISYRWTETPLVRVTSGYHDELEIQYRGEPVSTLSVFELALLNSGNQDIPETAWSTPMKLSFGDSARVLKVRINAVWDDDLHPRLRLLPNDEEARTVELQPLLLNHGDGMRLAFVVEGGVMQPPHARIQGVKRLEAIRDVGAPVRSPSLIVAFFIFAAVASAVVMATSGLTVAGSMITGGSLGYLAKEAWDRLRIGYREHRSQASRV